MAQPLALILYERLFPGGTLANRLQDLGYRVQSLSDPGQFPATAEREKPIIAIADLDSRPETVCLAIRSVRENPATAHVPVIAVLPGTEAEQIDQALAAGAKLVVQDNAILSHLSQFLDQALEIE